MKKYETPVVALEFFEVKDVISKSSIENDSHWTDFY